MAAEVWALDSSGDVQNLIGAWKRRNFDLLGFERIDDFACRFQSDDRRPGLAVVEILGWEKKALELLKSGLMAPVPFMVVSSVDRVELIRRFLRAGACDYLTLPVNKNELRVKIENNFRLNLALTSPQGLKLDSFSLSASNAKTTVQLTGKEFQILSLLTRAPQFSLNRLVLYQKIWNGISVSSKTLDVHIYNLRRKIDDLGLLIGLDEHSNCYRLQSRETKLSGLKVEALGSN